MKKAKGIRIRKKSGADFSNSPHKISKYYIPSSIPISGMRESEVNKLFNSIDLYCNESTELVEPIRNLMLAVMVRAWRDCTPSPGEGKRVRRAAQADAIAWLEEKHDFPHNPFSLEQISETLGFDKEKFKRICLADVTTQVQLTLFA